MLCGPCATKPQIFWLVSHNLRFYDHIVSENPLFVMN
jgi:hypothetical protein